MAVHRGDIHRIDVERITWLFADDPQSVLDLLMSVSRELKKEEPGFSEAWAAIHRNLDLAREATKPLYRG